MNSREALFVSMTIVLQVIVICWNTYRIDSLQLRVSYLEARHAKDKKIEKPNPRTSPASDQVSPGEYPESPSVDLRSN